MELAQSGCGMPGGQNGEINLNLCIPNTLPFESTSAIESFAF